jgi:hypothetical protein
LFIGTLHTTVTVGDEGLHGYAGDVARVDVVDSCRPARLVEGALGADRRGVEGREYLPSISLRTKNQEPRTVL